MLSTISVSDSKYPLPLQFFTVHLTGTNFKKQYSPITLTKAGISMLYIMNSPKLFVVEYIPKNLGLSQIPKTIKIDNTLWMLLCIKFPLN